MLEVYESVFIVCILGHSVFSNSAFSRLLDEGQDNWISSTDKIGKNVPVHVSLLIVTHVLVCTSLTLENTPSVFSDLCFIRCRLQQVQTLSRLNQKVKLLINSMEFDENVKSYSV